MREARIILPYEHPTDWRTSLPERRQFEREFMAEFGGYTAFRGSGGWVDDKGRECIQRVMIYDIAMPDIAAGKLREMAERACKVFAQKSIYMRTPRGEVYLVEPTEDE